LEQQRRHPVDTVHVHDADADVLAMQQDGYCRHGGEGRAQTRCSGDPHPTGTPLFAIPPDASTPYCSARSTARLRKAAQRRPEPSVRALFLRRVRVLTPALDFRSARSMHITHAQLGPACGANLQRLQDAVHHDANLAVRGIVAVLLGQLVEAGGLFLEQLRRRPEGDIQRCGRIQSCWRQCVLSVGLSSAG
jgi:hypothetical protein